MAIFLDIVYNSFLTRDKPNLTLKPFSAYLQQYCRILELYEVFILISIGIGVSMLKEKKKRFVIASHGL